MGLVVLVAGGHKWSLVGDGALRRIIIIALIVLVVVPEIQAGRKGT